MWLWILLAPRQVVHICLNLFLVKTQPVTSGSFQKEYVLLIMENVDLENTSWKLCARTRKVGNGILLKSSLLTRFLLNNNHNYLQQLFTEILWNLRFLSWLWWSSKPKANIDWDFALSFPVYYIWNDRPVQVMYCPYGIYCTSSTGLIVTTVWYRWLGSPSYPFLSTSCREINCDWGQEHYRH